MSSDRPTQPKIDDELRRLIAAVCDGLASAAERDQLQARLLAEPEAQKYYVDYLDLHAELQWRSRGTAMFGGSGDHELGGEVLRPLAKVRRLLLRPTPFSLTTAALVMGLLITALAFMSPPIYRAVMRGGTATDTAFVAEVSRTHSAVWKPLRHADVGTQLLAVGQQLELARGLAEIQFYRGARVTVEGPVTLRITGDNGAALDHGKLVARVDDTAHGFEIQTPAATVRDLGTEFAVAVTKQGATDIHVFQGKVEVRSANTAANRATLYLVVAGERLEVAASGMAARSPSVDGGAKFVRRVPPQANELRITDAYVQAIRAAKPAIYWRFEAATDGRISNEMSPDHALTVVGGVRLLPSDEKNNSAVFGGAREKHYLTCGKVDLLAGSQYSVELWCQPYTRDRASMVMLGLARDLMTDSLMLSLEGKGQRGAPVGSVRYLHRSTPGGTGGSNLFSTELLAVGQWHHTVAVYDDGVMRLYVNGKLKESAAVPTPALNAAAQVLLLGRLRSDDVDPRALVGRLDEVAIYARALTELEVRQHYELVKQAPGEKSRPSEAANSETERTPRENMP